MFNVKVSSVYTYGLLKAKYEVNTKKTKLIAKNTYPKYFLFS